MKKTLFVLLALMTLVFAQSADAIQLRVMDYGPNCVTVTGWCNLLTTIDTPAYLMAWEVLHPQTGLTTEASLDNLAGPLQVYFEKNVRANASLGILVRRNDDGSLIATFLSAGDASRYILFLEDPASDIGMYDEIEYEFYDDTNDGIANIATTCGNKLAADYEVPDFEGGLVDYNLVLNSGLGSFRETLEVWAMPAGITYPILARSSANISGQTYIAFEVLEDFTLAVYAPVDITHFRSVTSNGCRPVAEFYRWEGWPSNTLTHLFQVSSDVNVFEYVGPGQFDMVDSEGPTFHKEKGFPCTDQSTIDLAFNAPGENSAYMTYAQFTQQFQYGANASAIAAELDTDNDFKTFVVGSGDNVLATTIGLNNLNDLFFLNQLNDSTLGFIAFAPTLSTSTATVTLHSAAPEPGVTININNSATNCSTSNNTDFTCAAVPLNIGSMGIDVTVNVASQRIPTAWTITNVTISSNIITAICGIVGSRPIGIWSGGLEVFSAKAGTGTGTVTANSGAINCGGTCSDSYVYNTSVTLTATATDGSAFMGWSGGGCAGTGTCTVTVTTTTSVTATFDTCTYGINPTSVAPTSAGAVGSTVAVTTTPNVATCTWSATANNAWLTITAGTPGAGSGTLTYNIAANATAARTGTITIAGETFTVNQAVASYTFTATKDGTGTGTVTANSGAINCGGTCSDSYIYNTVVTLTATGDAGSGFAGWAGCAIVSGNQCTVTMDAAKNVTATFNTCAYGINPASINVTAAGATGSTVTVTATPNVATCTWSATANNAWLTVTAGTPGAGSGTVTYNVAANGGLARSGTITIAGQALTVNQADGCAFNLNPSMLTMANTGGNSSVNITASDPICPWTAAANNSWITIIGGAPGAGSGTLTFRVAANTGADRAGSITIAGRTFRVTQVAPAPTADCIYQIVPESAAYGHAGGQGTVWVGTQGDCLGWAWGATSQVDWLQVTGVQGNTVSYHVLANPTGLPRTGTILIANTDFTVTQSAGEQSLLMEGNTVDFGLVLVGSTASTTLTITNSGTGPVDVWIDGIAGSGEFSYSTTCDTVLPQDSCTLTIICNPSSIGPKSATLTLVMGGQGYPIMLSGQGVLSGVPDIRVSPTSLYFTGQELEQGLTSKDVTITNRGNATLVVRRTQLLGPNVGEFRVTKNCTDIKAGESCNETLSIQPTSDAPVWASLSVQSNDPDRPAVEVPVRVEGQAGCQGAIAIDPMSIEVGPDGQRGSFSVTASEGCWWLARSGKQWITVDEQWQQGSATVQYTVEGNPWEAARLGHVMVGGNDVLVLQYATGQEDAAFDDLPVEQWTHVYIEALHAAGLVNGCGQGLFCSEENITREQAIAFVIKALEGHPDEDYCQSGTPFTDVPAERWSCRYVKRAKELGLTKGCGGGLFCPEEELKRNQMAALVTRALLGDGFSYEGGQYFQDLSADMWVYDYAHKLWELGYVKGCAEGQFCSELSIQRKYMAVLFGRIFLGMQ